MLLVIDNTTAMAPYSARVSELATTAADALTSIGHGMANIQIAVTTNGGALSPIVADRVDWNGSHTSSFTGSLRDAVAAIANVGAAATTPSQPLAALRGALATPSVLVRSGGYLAIVTMTATDDASPTDDYVSFVKSSKSDPADVLVSGIYPTASPNLDAFHQAFPNRNTTISIDSADYREAFLQLTQVQKSTLDLPCFEVTLADTDPATLGIQPECDVRAFDDNNVEFAAVPMCTSSSEPPSGTCWQLALNADCGDYSEFQLRGLWATYHPQIRVECVASP